MTRYGKSAEDFARESAALDAAMKARKGVAAAEVEMTSSLDSSSAALERAAGKTRLYNKAKQEQAAFEERASKVHVDEARAADVETAAIERLAAARQRAAGASAAAFRGARDPLFGQASALNDPVTGVSQYELRRQLQIGSQRASRLQEALGAGFQPAATSGGALAGAATRQEAARVQSAEADIAYADAVKAKRNAVNRGDAAAVVAADADIEGARAAREAAKLELESATRAAAARDEAAAAIQADAAAAKRAGVAPGTALVPRTLANGAQGGPLFGQYPYAPLSREQQVGRPGAQDEFPRRLYGAGSEFGYDQTHGPRAVGKAGADAAAFTKAQEEQLLLDTRFQQAMAGQEAAVSRVGRAYRFSGVELGTASQQMTRHGALTSEFITAAARGETTVKELGNQALITAGKFSAWTLAATAVYGAVSSLGKVGRGAIDAQSGVHQLTRVVNDVNPDTAASAFGDLAGQFNVPVKDASDAVYRMGQVFHSQADAVQASKAALYSYKTGEVDVATSTTNLIAIQRAFGLSSNDLLSIYDQINQAQNTFGISIGNTEAGLAKAGGTFKNAGGDLNYLLALFVAIQKATGRTGQEIGTGIARAATQIRKPKNQAELRALGVEVDPNNLQTTIQSALSVARKPGSDYNAIASGLFGNQYARLIAPVLRDQTTLNQAIKDTSPEASKNSAQKELAKTLKEADQQIQQIGINLERLGVELERAGAFDFAGGLLKGLNLVLGTAVDLVKVFNALPAPLRSGLAILGEMYVAMALLKKFGAADSIGARLGFQGSRDNQEARLIRSGLSAGNQEAVNLREASSRRAIQAASQAKYQRDALTGFDRSYQGRVAAGASEEELTALKQQRLRLEALALRAEERAVELELEANAAREEVVAFETDIAATKKLQAEQGSAAVVGYAGQQGWARPQTFNKPDSRGATLVERQGIGAATGLPMIIPAGMTAEEAGARPEATARSLGRLEQAILPYTAGLRTIGEKTEGVSRSSKPLRAVAGAAATAADRAAGAMAGAGGALKTVGSSIGGLLASLGPLDYALIGLLAFTEVKSLADDYAKKSDAVSHQLESTPGSQRAYQNRLTRKPSDPGILGFPAEALAAVQSGGQTKEDYQRQLHNEAVQEDAVRRNIQTAARQMNLPVPQRFLGEITRDMASDAKKRAEGIISVREFDRRLAQHMIEIREAYNTSDAAAVARARAQAALEKRQNAPQTNLAARFAGAGVPELQADMKLTEAQYTDVSAQGGGRGLRLAELGAEYQALRTQLATSNDPKLLLQLLQARQEYFKALEDGVNAELTSALTRAHTPQARDQAYAAAATQLRRLPQNAERQTANDVAARARAVAAVALDRSNLKALGPVAQFTGIQQRINADTAALNALNTKVKKDTKDVQAALLERRDALQKISDDRYTNRQQGRQTDLAYQQSRTTDKGQQDALAIQFAAQQVKDAQRTYGTGSDQWKQAMTVLNNARNSATDYIIADAQAEAALISARGSGTPGGSAQAAVQAAQLILAATARDPHLKGHDRALAIKQANASLISANIAYGNFLRDQATAIAAARFTLQESQTTDPVKRAQIELAAARDAISRARTPQDKITAQATYNDKRNALIQTRVQATEDTIDFDLTMQRITSDQAIAELQTLLKTHNLTQATRRQVLTKIKQLKDAAASASQGFDLDVGNIKLPTIYDVRRAIGGLRGAMDQGSRAQFNNKIDVNVTVTDPKAAGAVYDALDRAMGTSVAAGVRQAGLSL